MTTKGKRPEGGKAIIPRVGQTIYYYQYGGPLKAGVVKGVLDDPGSPGGGAFIWTEESCAPPHEFFYNYPLDFVIQYKSLFTSRREAQLAYREHLAEIGAPIEGGDDDNDNEK